MAGEWQAVKALAVDYSPVITAFVSPLTQAVLSYARKYLENDYNWLGKGEVLSEDMTDTERLEIEQALNVAWREVNYSMLGSIIALATQEVPENCLLCDGATYNRVDYPELWEVIADSLKLDADTFFVPDLQIRIPIGVPPEGVGAEGGEENPSVTLVVDHLPAHTHDVSIFDPGHLHQDLGDVTTSAGLVGEIPAPVTYQTGGYTLLAYTGITASASSTGEGEPVALPLPAVTGIVYAMVAR